MGSATNDPTDPTAPELGPEPAPAPSGAPEEAGPGAEAPSPDRVAAPVLSIGVGLFCVAVFVYVLTQGEPTDELLAQVGAPDADRIWAGALWGLLTSNLVHVEPIHLLANLSWVWTLGCVVERRVGRAAWLALLVGAGLASSGAQLVAADQTGIGLSGVVYAWAGFAWAARRADRPLSQAIAGQQTWLLVWLLVCYGATTTGLWNVANAAHLAGLVFGLVAGHAWAGAPPASRLSFAAAVVLAVASVLPGVWAPWSAAWWYRRGAEAADNDDPEGARHALDAALARDPDHAMAHWRRAYLRWDDGDLVGADADLTAYLDHVRTWPGGYEARARLREQLGRAEEALADLDAAVRLEKTARLLMIRARARWRAGRLGDCLHDCDEALPLATEVEQRRDVLGVRQWVLQLLERHALAARDLDALVELAHDEPWFLYQRGVVRLQADDRAGAAADLRRVVDEAPRDSSGDALRADALEALGELDAALAVSEQACVDRPDDVAALRSRGSLRFLGGELDGARADYDRAIELDGEAAYDHLARGLLAALAGDMGRAKTELEQALDPDDPFPALWVAGLLGERGVLLEHAGAERPWPTPIVHYLLDERSAEAMLASAAEAPTARRVAERLCEAHAFVALTAERAGHLDRAREHYRRCVEQGIVTYFEHRWALARLAQLGDG